MIVDGSNNSTQICLFTLLSNPLLLKVVLYHLKCLLQKPFKNLKKEVVFVVGALLVEEVV